MGRVPGPGGRETVSRQDPATVRVTVVGGGLAGIAAALACADAGAEVTLWEAKKWLGGATSSLPPTIVLTVAGSAMALTWSMGERVAMGP